jgi:diguanylate cyclase (GGDEF)-like protein
VSNVRRTGLSDEHLTLALLLVAVGLMAGAFSWLAPVTGEDHPADQVIAVIALLAALAALAAVPRFGRPAVHVLLVVFSVLAAWLVGVRVTPQGQATAAYLLAFGALYAAAYLPRWQMLAQVALMSVLFALASTLGPAGLEPFYIGVRVASVVLVAEIVWRLVDRQRELLAEVSALSDHDPLTGALNRRGAVSEAERVRSVVARAGSSTTVSVVDLDGFKGYNDERGHQAGDRLLADLVAAWAATLRAGDVLARIGGDEFLVVLPQTDEEAATHLLTRMRAANPYPWTVGTTVWRPDEGLFDAAARADDALYAGKLTRHLRATGPTADG